MTNFIRMTPPATGVEHSITVNGRTYVCVIGSTLDVPDFDASVLEANGWISTAGSNVPVVTTANRPTINLIPGKTRVLDTTVGAVVTYTGVQAGVQTWTHSVTGGSV